MVETPMKERLRIGVTGRLHTPTGNRDSYTSDEKFSGEVQATASGEIGHVVYSTSLGTHIRSKSSFASIPLGTSVQIVAAAGWQNTAKNMLVGVEVPISTVVVADKPFSSSVFAADVLSGVHYWPHRTAGLHAGMGMGLTAALGEAACRAFLGIEYWPVPESNATPLKKEIVLQQPVEVFQQPVKETVPEPEKETVVSIPDTDKDGLDDVHDNCPLEAGTLDNNGCKNVQSVQIQDNKIAVLEMPRFDTAKESVKKESLYILDNVADVLIAHPDIVHVTVCGHTDNVGQASKNLKLSEKRAEFVMRYLISKGVDRARLDFQGFGQEKPIESNDTAEGRNANRRVEFIINQRDALKAQ